MATRRLSLSCPPFLILAKFGASFKSRDEFTVESKLWQYRGREGAGDMSKHVLQPPYVHINLWITPVMSSKPAQTEIQEVCTVIAGRNGQAKGVVGYQEPSVRKLRGYLGYHWASVILTSCQMCLPLLQYFKYGPSALKNTHILIPLGILVHRVLASICNNT